MNSSKKHCKNKDNLKKTKEKNEQIDSILLPGLPNHLAHLCLSTLNPKNLYGVCKSWRNLIYSPHFPPFFSLYALMCQSSSSVGFFYFDPISWKWTPLPSPPCHPTLSILRRHPSFISRTLPIQSITASNRLVLLAANTHNFLPALTHPLVFDPLSCKWNFGPPLSTPRRWCVTGAINDVVYVASGIGAKYHSNVARSLEKWDMSKKETEWNWETKASYKDGKFSREAIEAIGCKNKLCMVNIKGKAVKEGAVYNVAMDRWEEISMNMLEGWNGPATVYDDVVYVVNQESGSLSKYDGDKDCWKVIIDAAEELKGTEHISAGRGKICAVSGDGRTIVIVDIVARPPKIWLLDSLEQMEVVAVQILPRMSLLKASTL
ncbi:hypothetical protein CDL12_21974 [Handroanthus impetiginosus]|uniref:F-box domain-containing protein n=1 Tax=Handroanthus impetiginosus TaxID=429701 RepID=A0A2G9GJV7_9LAMI|nr:hypothetical protein CDL12_21974 [Handroanthus impetiginosus]